MTASPPAQPGGASRGVPNRACAVHLYVYNNPVKRRELERRLRELGWKLQRHGGKHDVWSNADDSFTEYVPRHAEINERLARVILKRAKERQ